MKATQTPETASNRSGCPAGGLGEEFRPWSEEYQRDPYPFFARARREEPVFYSPYLDGYVITRYEDVAAVMKDPETFSASPVTDFVTPPCEAAMAELQKAGFVPGSVAVNEDEPEHSPHRNVLRRAFSKDRMAELDVRVRNWVK